MRCASPKPCRLPNQPCKESRRCAVTPHVYGRSAMNSALNAHRTLEELKELRALTGDEHGAQRVAFTPTWVAAREWLSRKLKALPVKVHTDEAGNLWATLRGKSHRALLIGGHIDSVPNGGWLDGSLN